MANTNGTIIVSGGWTGGREYTVVGKLTIGGSITTADTFTLPNILPVNAVRILETRVYGAEVDTNASPSATVVVGNSDDPDGYLKSKTGGNAINYLLFQGDGDLIGAKVSNRTVILTVGGTIATSATSGDIYVLIRYLCDVPLV